MMGMFRTGTGVAALALVAAGAGSTAYLVLAGTWESPEAVYFAALSWSALGGIGIFHVMGRDMERTGSDTVFSVVVSGLFPVVMAAGYLGNHVGSDPGSPGGAAVMMLLFCLVWSAGGGCIGLAWPDKRGRSMEAGA